MKKSISLIVLLMLMLGTTAWAQNSKLETGIIAYQNNEFKKALDYFNEAITNKAELSAKNVPRAYYYRGMCHLKVMGEEARGMVGKEPTEEQGKALEAHLMTSFDDFKQAKATDDGKWGKKVTEALNSYVNVAFLQSGLVGDE